MTADVSAYTGKGPGRSVWSKTGLLLLALFAVFAYGVLVVNPGSTSIRTLSLVFSSIVLEAVPFMLFGALVGGMIEVFVSRERMAALLPKRGWMTIAIAAGMGILFPVCECAVVPVVRRLARKGLPASAAIAYLLGGPIVNPIVAASTALAYKFDWRVVGLRMVLGYGIAVAVALVMGRIFGNGLARRGIAGRLRCAPFRGVYGTGRDKRIMGNRLLPPGKVAAFLALLMAFPFSAAQGQDQSAARRLPKPAAPAASFNTVESLERAILDLTAAFGERYPNGKAFLARLAMLKAKNARPGDAELDALAREALLANPLLDFDRLLLVRRLLGGGDAKGKPAGNKPLGLPQNWQGNCVLPKSGFDNEIAVLSPVRPGGKLTTVHRPAKPVFVGDVDLHFDGTKMLFSSVGENGRWQIFEVGVDGKNLRQVTKGDQPDVDHYDACYLPNERIVFASTACIQGIPCVGGRDQVANLYLMNADGGGVRRLCFDQDQNWCPTVMNDGRVMFTRWEYSDTPHYFTRLLFSMNPDGVGQMALYGSNSYWPNSIFYARPVPGHSSKFVGIVSGHHGAARMGELVLFDVGRGQFEADGAVQRTPGFGRPVNPVIRDGLVDNSWPKFLHPFPLSAKYILAASMPTPASPWGLYLVDVFDNMICLAEAPGEALLEPVPLRAVNRPPVIPDRVNLRSKEGTVYMNDVYFGPGLKGIPRGTIKSLRLFAFHYGYQGLANHTYIGIDGPWDVHRILGTVPVEPDGSALFNVPANTPIAVQPLDAEGRALQVMRSWYTAMPGELISCVGCHESQSDAPQAKGTAGGRRPSAIAPWFGPARGFSFKRDVQPVLDHYCVGCHDGGKAKPNLRPGKQGSFTTGYVALHPYVRRPGPESDYHVMPPADYAANTSELIQMLKKGHHGVALDDEAWQRLYTWIDLNVPDHGTWREFRDPGKVTERRLALHRLYTNMDDDPEAIPELPPPDFAKRPKPAPGAEAAKGAGAAPPPPAGWPMTADEARKRQAASGKAVERIVDLGAVKLPMVLIPAGEFVMGSNAGDGDEAPAHLVKIANPFWMAKTEITNEQFCLFDPTHDSRYISVFGKDQTSRGIPVNDPQQPVVRIAWTRAAAFCRWLSARTGEAFTLPTEAQWEYSCRAGTATPMHYGAAESDYGKFANLADASLNLRANWHLKNAHAKDGSAVSAKVGRYAPNAWGLCDMHGNVAEWTASVYKPYPVRPGDDRELTGAQLAALADKPGEHWPEMAVRGGSWYDRAKRATSSFRLAYPAWQGIYNVGFRVVVELDGQKPADGK